MNPQNQNPELQAELMSLEGGVNPAEMAALEAQGMTAEQIGQMSEADRQAALEGYAHQELQQTEATYQQLLEANLTHGIEDAKRGGEAGVAAVKEAEHDASVEAVRSQIEAVFSSPEMQADVKEMEKRATEAALERTGVIEHGTEKAAEALVNGQDLAEEVRPELQLEVGQKIMVKGQEVSTKSEAYQQAMNDRADFKGRNNGMSSNYMRRAGKQMFGLMKSLGIKNKVRGSQQEAWAGAVLAAEAEAVNTAGGAKRLDVTNVNKLQHAMDMAIGQEEVKALANNKMTKAGREKLQSALTKSPKLRRNFGSAMQSYRSTGHISQGTARQLGKEIRESSEFSQH